MAKFVVSMNVSLDGYVDHEGFAPGPELFRHWIDQVRGATASLYGRRIYEIMRYWETPQPEWTDDHRAFAAAWLAQPKWVAATTLASVGPNATLVAGDVEAVARRLKADLDGEVAVSGTVLAQSLGEIGLIDEYRLYYHPVVLGRGKPFFAGPLPRLRLVASEPIADEVIRLTYAPA
ncbi:MAG: dihydrofolate reductase family protein [Tabrizicola sp.]|uniref:dihydrofolate reductase family protein n=1 Tax=Tabrizicola sp. TaxID=2005166 RepID=UPI0027357EFE|nr:dihydrofolate reductase family protein [Tabrizicola sp.]MDP3262859.1 dihydrofolate reductase family protein [Tabrizicola sp.]MDP3649056.1 dihydrofolate reductase family protein [Paracoccaceae bacterium]